MNLCAVFVNSAAFLTLKITLIPNEWDWLLVRIPVHTLCCRPFSHRICAISWITFQRWGSMQLACNSTGRVWIDAPLEGSYLSTSFLLNVKPCLYGKYHTILKSWEKKLTETFHEKKEETCTLNFAISFHVLYCVCLRNDWFRSQIIIVLSDQSVLISLPS